MCWSTRRAQGGICCEHAVPPSWREGERVLWAWHAQERNTGWPMSSSSLLLPSWGEHPAVAGPPAGKEGVLEQQHSRLHAMRKLQSFELLHSHKELQSINGTMHWRGKRGPFHGKNVSHRNQETVLEGWPSDTKHRSISLPLFACFWYLSVLHSQLTF